MKKTLLFLTTINSILLATTPAELTKNNCTACHILSTPTPEQISTLQAPPMEAVMLHVKMVYDNKKSSREFIVDYVQNPSASKSVCESNKVQKFGVMPSIKGKVSPEDIEKIADYLYDNYPTKKFSSMIKEIQTNNKLKMLKNSPFLINSDALPHMTKLLIQNWDKATIGLSKEQKEKLLVVRKETLGAIKKIKESLAPLEAQVTEDIVDEDITKLKPIVDKIAKLKAQATMAHIKCIKDTVSILNDEQLEALVPFWDN